MTALERYYRDYVKMPDFDLDNDINRVLFFKEGGFVRFTPKFPDGGFARYFDVVNQGTPLPGVAMPQIDQPSLRYDDVQHIQAATQAVGNFSRIRQGNQQLKMQKEQQVIDNEMAKLNLQARKDELDFRKTAFEHQKLTDNFTMMNTIKDEILNLEYLPEDATTIEGILTGKDWGNLFELATSGDNPDAMSQLQKAAMDIKMNPAVIRAQVKKKKFDDDQTLIKSMNPEFLNNYTNYNERQGAIVNGQAVPEFKVDNDKYQTDLANQKELDQYTAEATIELRKQQALKAKSEGYKAQIQATIDKAQWDDYQKEVDAIEASNLTDDEKTNKKEAAARKYEGKFSNSNQNLGGVAAQIQFYEDQGYDLETARRMVHEDMAKDKTMTYNMNGTQASGDPTQSVADPKSALIMKGVGYQYGQYANAGENGAILSKAVLGSASQLTLHGTTGQDDQGNYIPRASTIGANNAPHLTGKDAYAVSSYKVNDDGSVSTVGQVTTSNKELAEWLEPGVKPVKVATDGTPTYVINGVITTATSEQLNLNGIQPKATTSAAPSTTPVTGEKPKYQNNVDILSNMSNVSFGSYSDGTKQSATDLSTRSQEFIGTLTWAAGDGESPINLQVTGTSHHNNPDSFDIGMGSSGTTNQKAFEFLSSTEGEKYLIMNGYEVHHEFPTNSGEPDKPVGYKYNDTMWVTKNDDPKAKGIHLHVQNFQPKPAKFANLDVQVTQAFKNGQVYYTLSGKNPAGERSTITVTAADFWRMKTNQEITF